MQTKGFNYQKMHEIYTMELIRYPVCLPVSKILYSSIKLLIHQLNIIFKRNIPLIKEMPCNTLINPANQSNQEKFEQLYLKINRIY